MGEFKIIQTDQSEYVAEESGDIDGLWRGDIMNTRGVFMPPPPGCVALVNSEEQIDND